MTNFVKDGPPPRLLVTDLDNTLWDWFGAWHASFEPMLERLIAQTGAQRTVLESEIRAVHQRRGTSEYSALIDELPSTRRHAELVGCPPRECFNDALHIQNSYRRAATKLYPGVLDTLEKLRSYGVTIVGYSESVAYWTEWRLKYTRLDGILDAVFTAPDHVFPEGVSVSDLRYYEADHYGLRETSHRHTPRGTLKPAPEILRAILEEFECGPDHTIYVGDSLMKDSAMAQDAQVCDVYAAYGVAQDRAGYDLLRRVSHWPDDDVNRERKLSSSRDISPSVTLNQDFSEVLQLFESRREVPCGR